MFRAFPPGAEVTSHEHAMCITPVDPTIAKTSGGRLVGRAYGGAAITAAATQVANVEALAHLNAFALAQGERVGDISQRFTNDQLATALLPRPFPQAGRVRGAPISPSTRRSSDRRSPPMFLASWYLVGSRDQAIDPRPRAVHGPAGVR
jgi:hypothetical protein